VVPLPREAVGGILELALLATQLRAGMAWWYREYAKKQNAEERATCSAAEDDARSARRGFWKDAKPVVPLEWRSRRAK
jgi:endonuclease YncB( thermonuclease family)